MPDTAPRPYRSALRAEQARATAGRLVDAFLDLLEAAPAGGEVPLDAVAAAAGVERRTLFRHFPTREALLAAAFARLNDRIGTEAAPRDPAGFLAALREAFARFDGAEGAVRAALHSAAGREMRARQVPERREAFAAALGPALAAAPPEAQARALALAHLLYSAAAWEVLKDYGGLTGAQAGETAAWALETILSAIAPGPTPADAPSPSKDQSDDA
jgi:AcrR family transcriptional regulator